jgi:hypothetical protein
MKADLFDLLGDQSMSHVWVEQGTREWDEIRVGKFTGSEIHKLITPPKDKAKQLSETALDYIQDKVAEVLTGQSKPQAYAYSMMWGKDKEDEAREMFISKTGFDVERVGFFCYTDHAGGSPDGLVNEDAIMEIKCPYDSSKMIDYLMLNDVYDLKGNFKDYYWQMQANMLFTGRSKGHFVAYDPRMIKPEHQMKHLVIDASEADQNLLIEKIKLAVEEKLSLIKLLE